jgi:uncharacterized protein YkwD
MLTRLKTCALFLALAALWPSSALANCGRAADRDPTGRGGSLAAARSATLCLVNAERSRFGRRALRANAQLALAGVRHASDMVTSKYFSHDEPSGQDFVQRILSADYAPASALASAGENLAWGTMQLATPRSIVRSWMTSATHRENLLSPDYREIGIAIVVGAPVAGMRGATYAAEFGAVG